jgi:hypothetical protein
MPNKISNDEITSPVLISKSNYTNIMKIKKENNSLNNNHISNKFVNNNKIESANSIMLNNKSKLAGKYNAFALV